MLQGNNIYEKFTRIMSSIYPTGISSARSSAKCFIFRVVETIAKELLKKETKASENQVSLQI